MAKATKVTPFPPRVYVCWGDDGVGDDRFLTADETTAGIEHGKPVAIYELRETRTMRVTRTLDPETE